MAYPTDSININRTTTIQLPSEVSAEILAGVEGSSAVMQLARKIEVPGRGLTIPVVTGDPVAEMVAETAEKPVSNSTLNTKLMKPQKFAVIELFSDEFRRDASALYDELIRRLPGAIAKAFDAQVFAGTAVSGFDVLTGVDTVTAGDTPADDVKAAMLAVAAENGEVNGFAVSPAYYVSMVTAVDGINRPLFTPGFESNQLGLVYGSPVAKSEAVNLMFAGDWAKAMYGIVDGINISYSADATVNDGTNQINLWQRNMFAVRVEAEIGFVADTEKFVQVVSE